jgi:hypothetical protein
MLGYPLDVFYERRMIMCERNAISDLSVEALEQMIWTMPQDEIDRVHNRQAFIQTGMLKVTRLLQQLPPRSRWAAMSLMYQRIGEVIEQFEDCFDRLRRAHGKNQGSCPLTSRQK